MCRDNEAAMKVALREELEAYVDQKTLDNDVIVKERTKHEV